MPSENKTSHRWFVTTRWTMVLAAGGSESKSARDALEQLCQTYWQPLFAFARRSGHSPHDAEDLVQGFIAKCLEKNYLAAADRSRGRFRTFLLTAFKRFLANEWDHAQTLKRGGARQTISLDSLAAEERYAIEPVENVSAEQLYERRWALTLLERVFERLEEEQKAAGKRKQFECLKEALTVAGAAAPYARLARDLGLSEGAVKVAIHRLRRRYRELLEEEIAHTVAEPGEIERERRHLLAVLSG